MITKEVAIERIRHLVERFEEQKDFYSCPEYNETLTRRDFIDPFFQALGWDVANEQGYAESYREVIHEDRVRTKGRSEFPDYSFRLPGGKRLFFVEAKKPSIVIREDIFPAYQVRRYGWSAQLNISIVTDFEEFAVYDCTQKPRAGDKAATARIKYLRYHDYLREFDFIWNTFSKERVLKGSFDRFIQSGERKGTMTVDSDFPQSLNRWRKLLASSICRSNPWLNEDELNYAVQHTIDRIIFLRIAEDRGVEPHTLREDIQQGNYYDNLLAHFKQADEKYNSGLFDHTKDRVTRRIAIDNKTLKAIITDLYYPNSSYEFSVIPVEILGTAYEQFLGKRIKITASHRARIDEDSEIRKESGVYYTPQYIVDHIVESTVGKLVENKSPKEISRIRIVDPTCGSGSFLLGAYQYLLSYHKKYYAPLFNELNRKAGDNSISVYERNVAVKERNKLPLTPTGELKTSLKKEILVNNIFGVDQDVNAVEVTKLSLLLKCMEGETTSSIQALTFNEHVLPTLENNIKCGNSLVDTNYFDHVYEDALNVKPFSWQKAFSSIFAQGGFDAVVGNPPWVDLKGHPKELVSYYFKYYQTTENRINLYAIFLERELSLLNNNGVLGIIIPSSILYQSSYTRLRKLILDKWNIHSIARLPDDVFKSVKAETLVMVIGKERKPAGLFLYDRDKKISVISSENCTEYRTVDTKAWKKSDDAAFNIYNDPGTSSILAKIEKGKAELGELCSITLGITPYDKYKGHTERQIAKRVFHSNTAKDETFKPLLEGADVKRYNVKWGGKEHISYGEWLGAPREQRFFTEPRILVRQIISGNPPRIYAGYTDEELYNTQSVFNILVKKEARLSTKYLLALLNSNLINFYHGHKYLDLSKRLFQKILIQNCRKLPIKKISFKNSDEKQLHDEIVEQAGKLLKLYDLQYKETLMSEMLHREMRINHCEEKLNKLVYKLYDLTPEEITVIENAMQPVHRKEVIEQQ